MENLLSFFTGIGMIKKTSELSSFLRDSLINKTKKENAYGYIPPNVTESIYSKLQNDKEFIRIQALLEKLKMNKWTTNLAYNLKYSDDVAENVEKTTKILKEQIDALKIGDVKDQDAIDNAARTAIEMINRVTSKIEMQYEAFLCQCSYLSRMAYTQADVFCRMTEFLDLTPNAFNNYMRVIEKVYSNDITPLNYQCSYDSLWLSTIFNPAIFKGGANEPKEEPEPKPSKYIDLFFEPEFPKIFKGTDYPEIGVTENQLIADKKVDVVGYFVQNNNKLNAYVYLHHNKKSKFNSKKTLFVAFKGTSSINDLINDLKSMNTKPIMLLSHAIANRIGKDVSAQAGGGFIDILSGTPFENTVYDISERLRLLLKKNNYKSYNVKQNDLTGGGENNNGNYEPIEQIVITGHSLGGALATLYGYALRCSKIIIDIPIHVVTFGEPNVINGKARQYINKELNISKTISDLLSGEANNDPPPSENNTVPISENIPPYPEDEPKPANLPEPGADYVPFTYDRIDNNGDFITIIPPNLKHAGYTILKKEFGNTYAKNYRTDKISKLRSFCGLTGEATRSDDYLSEDKYVKLFENWKDFFVKGLDCAPNINNVANPYPGYPMTPIPYPGQEEPEQKKNVNTNGNSCYKNMDKEKYKSKFRIRLGTDKDQQAPIFYNALPDAKEEAKTIFEKMEKVAIPASVLAEANQVAAKNSVIAATAEEESKSGGARIDYNTLTKSKMPNAITYNCYKIMSLGFCHATYMGVTYATVLRLPKVGSYLTSGKGTNLQNFTKKEPKTNYVLIKFKGGIKLKEKPDLLSYRPYSFNEYYNGKCLHPPKEKEERSKPRIKGISEKSLRKFAKNNSPPANNTVKKNCPTIQNDLQMSRCIIC